jgi:hypothetical protein|tara:strand:+ start:208 stop:426 length:219 start_codon:yes stop_codon:yes gene_type:complete
MKKAIDLTTPVHTYTVMMSEVRGYYIDVAASTPEQAMEYAEINKRAGLYKKYHGHIVDIAPVMIVEEEKPNE